MLSQEIIRKKRDGQAVSKAEIQYLINGMLDGSVTKAQISAFAMAVYFQDMDLEECQTLTECLLHSGTTLEWQDKNLDGPVVDKHSTGGLGDKVSLMIAPMLAACGAYIPMISGRALGHTGGTLDKMDSIPGYNTQPDIEMFQDIVSEVGCSIVGQTSNLAPADKMLYAIRDVTATVESIPLITASILSKKIAAGLQSLIIDVKVGSGSFNETFDHAEALANNLVRVGNGYGVKTTALITDMNQVLGTTMGNALEVKESIEYLNGTNREPRLHEIVINLAAELLVVSGISEDIASGIEQLESALSSGKAAAIFQSMVTSHGGPDDLLDSMNDHLARANVITPYLPAISAKSYLKSMDGRALGNLLITLGGGRRTTQDSIDYSVGFSDIKSIGDTVYPNKPLLMIHANSEEDAAKAKQELDGIFDYSATKITPGSPIMAIIRSSDYE